jgi:hypothetical protein
LQKEVRRAIRIAEENKDEKVRKERILKCRKLQERLNRAQRTIGHENSVVQVQWRVRAWSRKTKLRKSKPIDPGKEKGYLTYDDVNDMFPRSSSDQIDDAASLFGEMDIEVIDGTKGCHRRPGR